MFTSLALVSLSLSYPSAVQPGGSASPLPSVRRPVEFPNQHFRKQRSSSLGMKLQNICVLQPLSLPVGDFIGLSSFLVTAFLSRKLRRNAKTSVSRVSLPGLCSTNFTRSPLLMAGNIRSGLTVEKTEAKREVKAENEESNTSDGEDNSYVMNENERQEFRREVRKVMNMNPNVDEEVDLDEKKKKMQKLLADYSLVVEEEDPDWPEDADG